MTINPLPDMPVEGYSNLAANKDMILKVWTNADTVIRLSRKHIVGKGKIAWYGQFLLCPQWFQNLSVVDASK